MAVVIDKKVPTGVFHNPTKTYNGYTLFAPVRAPYVWLIDMNGTVVHKWEMPFPRGLYAELLPGGNVLYAGHNPEDKVADFIGCSGELVEVDWDGNVVWRYADGYMHDGFRRLRNGNTLVLKWVAVPNNIAEKVKGGWPGTGGDIMWGDSIQEINPAGKVVWEWIGYKHLDSGIDTICPNCPRNLWAEANSLDTLPNGDVLVSFEKANTIAIVDKATGSIKWRWGRGELCHQHDATNLDNGGILIFDNGWHCELQGVGVSRIVEVDPTSGEIQWAYSDDPSPDFFSSTMSSCQRLPNGNTLICEGVTGRIFEVTQKKQIAWEYISPFFYRTPKWGRSNAIYRAYRYGASYEGLERLGAELVRR